MRELVHVLGRTAPGSQVTVARESVAVYAIGVFARDRVPLALGSNRLSIEATSASWRQRCSSACWRRADDLLLAP